MGWITCLAIFERLLPTYYRFRRGVYIDIVPIQVSTRFLKLLNLSDYGI